MMKLNSISKEIREYENLHIALWLVKDACWVMDWKVAGMVMILPTLLVAFHLTWKLRSDKTELFHSIAICLWIAANGTWMTGEFFYNDSFRPFAMIFFTAGLLIVGAYYITQQPRKSSKTTQIILEDVAPILPIESKKVA